MLPDTGRPADIELICWLRAPSLKCRGSRVGSDTQSHCRGSARKGPVLQEKKKVSSVAPPPTSSSVEPTASQQSSRNYNNPKHTACLLTLRWDNAFTLICHLRTALIMYEATSAAEKSDLSLRWTNPADGGFSDRRLMRRADCRAPRNRWFPTSERRCGKRNTMFTSIFCCNSCKSVTPAQQELFDLVFSCIQMGGNVMLCCVAKWK